MQSRKKSRLKGADNRAEACRLTFSASDLSLALGDWLASAILRANNNDQFIPYVALMSMQNECQC